MSIEITSPKQPNYRIEFRDLFRVWRFAASTAINTSGLVARFDC
jgi:hypothetical protein